MSKRLDRASRGRRPRARLLLIGGILTASLGLAITNSLGGDQPAEPGMAIDTTGTPLLQVDTDYVDFGDVSFNQMVEAVFEVANTGDATLLFAETPFIELKDGC